MGRALVTYTRSYVTLLSYWNEWVDFGWEEREILLVFVFVCGLDFSTTQTKTKTRTTTTTVNTLCYLSFVLPLF